MNIAGARPRRSVLWAFALGTVAAFSPLPASAQSSNDLSAPQTDVDGVARGGRGGGGGGAAKSNGAHKDRHSGKPVFRVHTRVASGVAIEESVILTTASAVIGADQIQVRTANDL